MHIHLFFDLLSYAIGAFFSWKIFNPKQHLINNEKLRYLYYTVVIIGAFIGAIALGTLNTYFSLENKNIIGKSILGAIIGGVVIVEIFKKIMGIQGSTGAYFVPSLAFGIALGRIGCFLSGLEDYTYGIATDSFWGYDFGDGIARHPVQLYESAIMILFFLYVLWRYFQDRDYFEKYIFYQFILVYATQRFIWEFLKPYETVVWNLNIFQLFCIALILYALYHLKPLTDYKRLFSKVYQ